MEEKNKRKQNAIIRFIDGLCVFYRKDHVKDHYVYTYWLPLSPSDASASLTIALMSACSCPALDIMVKLAVLMLQKERIIRIKEITRKEVWDSDFILFPKLSS